MGLFTRKDSQTPPAENGDLWSPASAPNGSGGATVGKSGDATLTLRKSLYEFGRERALASKDTHSNEAVLHSLEEHAEAMAREQGATLFDSEQSAHDRLKQDKLDKAKSQIPKSEGEVAVAAEDVRKRRDALAELGELPSRPEIPWWLIFLGAFFIGLTTAPSLHDFLLSDVEDQRLAWMMSIFAGSFAGLVISWCLLGMFDSTSRVTARWVGLVGGILFSIALLLIRLVGSEGRDALTMAVALAILELAVVVILDWIGGGLRHRYTEYQDKSVQHDRRLKLLQSGEKELACRQKLLDEQNAIVEDHLEHLRDRESRVKQMDSLISGARQAVRDGYFAGLAENEGKLHGRDY